MSYTKTETATTPPSRRKDAPGLPRLIVDTREQTPLTFLHMEAVRGTLATGDYSIEGMEGAFMVERKSVFSVSWHGCAPLNAPACSLWESRLTLRTSYTAAT